jgi:hypothetical protein
MYGRKDKKCCWEVENTLCNHVGIEVMREACGNKKEVCARSGCIYFKEAEKLGLVKG